MEKKLLIINVGTSSKKYAFYIGGQKLMFSHYERENGGFIVTHQDEEGKETKINIFETDFQNSSAKEIEYLVFSGLIKNRTEINAAGFRVVCPGVYFNKPQKIDFEYRQKLRENSLKAPLHIAAVVEEIERFAKDFPDIVVYGISDSNFYTTLIKEAKYYAFDNEIAKELSIERFGYHGISMQSVLRKLNKSLGDIPKNIIICHLGSGSSITAIKDGKAFDTSMGFTPLEGLVMATRTGDIDPGVLIYLMKTKGWNVDQLNEFLNKKCGLLGLSGKSDDIRELLNLEEKRDEQAKLALDLWAYRIKKYIGSYILALGGLDILIFTATVGERSWIMRQRILKDLEGLGFVIDDEKNKKITESNGEGEIQKDGSQIKILVVKTDEMEEIFEQLVNI